MADNQYTKGLDARHILDQKNLYEAARTGFFVLQIQGLSNLPKASNKNVTFDWATGEQQGATDLTSPDANEYIMLNVVKCDVPHFSVETLEYRRGNEVVKFAGVPSFEAGSVVVDDIVGIDTKSILMAWQGLVYNVHTRRGGRMRDYKRDATLIEYTQDYEPIRAWKLVGCWPSELSEDSFDRENDGKRQITATIEYDHAYLDDDLLGRTE